jgi:hypothetical protein
LQRTKAANKRLRGGRIRSWRREFAPGRRKKLEPHQIGPLPRLINSPGSPTKKEPDMATERMDDDVLEEPVPVMQQLLDNPFLLLFLGIAMPTVLYIVWGVMEIVSLPIAK